MPKSDSEQPAERTPLEHMEARLLGSLSSLFIHATELGEWALYLDWGDRLQSEGIITTPSIIRAFKTIKRHDFLPANFSAEAGLNEPVPIGHNQTNSQPSTVGQMLEWLKPRPAQNILDFGSGSGWTTAMLGKIVGKDGHVTGLERIPDLVKMGQANLAKYAIASAEIRQADDRLGLPEAGPFNRILVSSHLKRSWLEELSHQLHRRGGRLVAPLVPDNLYGETGLNCDMVAIDRHGREFVEQKLAEKYGFVPTVVGEDLGEVTDQLTLPNFNLQN